MGSKSKRAHTIGGAHRRPTFLCPECKHRSPVSDSHLIPAKGGGMVRVCCIPHPSAGRAASVKDAREALRRRHQWPRGRRHRGRQNREEMR